MRQRFLTVVIAAIVVVLMLARWGANLYTDWLWFGSLQYQSTFLTIILSEIGLKIAVGVAIFILLFINLMPTRSRIMKAASMSRVIEDEDNVISMYRAPFSKYAKSGPILAVYLLISLVMAFFVGTAVAGDWVVLQKFLHPTPFNIADPIFGKDIGFYVFQLPFYEFLYRLFVWALFLIAFWVAAAYFVAETINGNQGKGFLKTDAARFHLSALAAVYFFARAFGYRLDQYNILHSAGGIVYGPTYTDIHANLLAYKILFWVSIVIAVIILVNIFMKRFRLVLYSIASMVIISVLVGGIYPVIIQKIVVVPNELNKETPYIENSIKYTRMAYNLDEVVKKEFPAGRTLVADDIKNNMDTVENIRLWDYRPLQQTYAQIQEMRTYYELKSIDVDRYVINGEYRQLMLSPRELNQEQLPENAKTWVNQRLKYTHGYGIVASPVNQVTTEGLPQLTIKDIPPVTTSDIKVERPEIYFGESTDNYVIVNAREEEFDYPKGDENAYTMYQGTNGVKVGSLLKRAMFALSLGDYKLLLSSEVISDSQVLYYRSLTQRVPKIASFLNYDADPYMVIEGGKLYWIWDAYTTTSMYPYAEPFEGGLNYIRNSVKVVVDAYSGVVDYYIADDSDPLIKTYSSIFPGMFKPLGDMPEGLRNHIRYPSDMFMVQANKYLNYHMEDPIVFYNKEDQWNLPAEIISGKQQNMEPYYTIVKLPGESKSEYIQILPFTPHKKINMISWLAGRSDGENYGKLLLYEFPKQELVYGPQQIEARIDQDSYISQQITLWSQKGSSVNRGNLLVIPIKDSLLYVEPLYLQSEQSRMPELRRVIVAHGDRIVMEPTLEEALNKMFGKGTTVQQSQQPQGQEPQPGTTIESVKGLTAEANRIYEEGQNRLRAGDWAGYGESNKKLKETLDELSRRAAE
ncbi:MAG: hypothetical protein JL50_02800 [Peptococcaceae bacterium BICA1-7]|nr:MAG: hypothetical protein JL50_02800 [Peptococcaceae bacterium BICA1-7]HBV97807.1 UPF0182 family protein [Desulfotomaculum sp.]